MVPLVELTLFLTSGEAITPSVGSTVLFGTMHLACLGLVELSVRPALSGLEFGH